MTDSLVYWYVWRVSDEACLGWLTAPTWAQAIATARYRFAAGCRLVVRSELAWLHDTPSCRWPVPSRIRNEVASHRHHHAALI